MSQNTQNTQNTQSMTLDYIKANLAMAEKLLTDAGIPEPRVEIRIEAHSDRAQISLWGEGVDPGEAVPRLKYIFGELTTDSNGIFPQTFAYIKSLGTEEERNRKMFNRLLADAIDFGYQAGLNVNWLQEEMTRLSENVIEDKRT